MNDRQPFTSPTDSADLFGFTEAVVRKLREDGAFSVALDGAQPPETDNVRALVARKHGAIEVTLRFDYATWQAAREREDATPPSESSS